MVQTHRATSTQPIPDRWFSWSVLQRGNFTTALDIMLNHSYRQKNFPNSWSISSCSLNQLLIVLSTANVDKTSLSNSVATFTYLKTWFFLYHFLPCKPVSIYFHKKHIIGPKTPFLFSSVFRCPVFSTCLLKNAPNLIRSRAEGLHHVSCKTTLQFINTQYEV